MLTTKITNIADAIRNKTNATDKMTLEEMPSKIQNIITEPVLQDKSIKITENGTINIVADEGYDGIGNLKITISVSEGEESDTPNYIKNGMVAWFDGEDSMDENEHWNNRLNDDYIYIHSRSGTGSIKNTGGAYINNKNFSLITSADYYKTGYTIEIVGRVNSMNNSNGSTGGWLLTMNETGSWGIGVTKSNGQVTFLNNDASTMEQTFQNFYGRAFTGALYLENALPRGSKEASTNKGSVNGCDWFNIIETQGAYATAKNNHPIMCYYAGNGNDYRIDGAIYCIRIYNRKLTAEELIHNYEIDKLRYNLI